MAPDTGFTSQDVQSDFSRARRRRVVRRIASRLKREPDDIDVIMPFDEVVEALGKVGERRLGVRSIDLDSIIGTVDRGRDFDRSFRPTSPRVRRRWQGIASAMRRGESLPPISVYRIGEWHFVEDGHHRVSVARQLGNETIEANVKEIVTAVSPGEIRVHDLPLKSHERLFFERVPLPAPYRDRIRLSDGSLYAGLAEGVEAWGFRAMQHDGEFMSREQVALAWFENEYEPVVRMLRDADLVGRLSEAAAYMAVSSLRYTLLRTHSWDEDVLARVREEIHGRDGGTAAALEEMLRTRLR